MDQIIWSYSRAALNGTYETMSTYLLKLNCELHLGGAEPRPTTPEQWEGQTALFLPPRKLEGGSADEVGPGDTLIIWTHEDPGFGRGQGLTATATAGEVTSVGDERSVTMQDVRLLAPHLRLDALPEGPTGSELLDYLRSHRHRRAIAVTEQQADDFWSAIGALGKRQRDLIASYEAVQPKTPEERALEADKDNVAEGFQRRFSAVEVRPDQAVFRRNLMKAYGGRCALSGTNVGAVLQAAHVIPFSEAIELRNDVSNGLILRVDLHALFDKFLIAVHPVTNKVVVADSLRGTSYEQFAGRTVRHQVRTEFLRRAYEEFCRRSPKMDVAL